MANEFFNILAKRYKVRPINFENQKSSGRFYKASLGILMNKVQNGPGFGNMVEYYKALKELIILDLKILNLFMVILATC